MPASTPIYGFPYPLGTDPVTNGAQDIQNLATAVEGTIGSVVGLVKIVPSSVTGTGASVASNGDIVVTNGGTDFTVNGIFSALYQNYLFTVCDFRASGATGLFVSMGTSKSGTSHKFGGITISSGGAVTSDSSAGANAFSTGIVTRGVADSAGGEFKLYGPFLAVETSFTTSGSDSDNSGLGRFGGGRHMIDASYTAVIFSTFSTPTVTSCRVSVYGYN
jgi:hypothetical protein